MSQSPIWQRNRSSGNVWSTSWRWWLLLDRSAVHASACPAARPLAAARCHCRHSDSDNLRRYGSHYAPRASNPDDTRHRPPRSQLHVYCPSCYSTRRPANLGRWADRCFASARFRCSGTRGNGVPCRGIGMPVIRPSELLPVGGPVALAFLWCNSCIWEIDQAHLDKPPWSGSRQRYRCPGCSGAVRWHIHGPAWRPFESRDSPWWL
jgi:hypothetical protein